MLRLAGRREPGAHPTVWLDHDRPLAFSLPGKPGLVVATEGLRRHLTPEEVDAVLDHERAHLNGRHHLLVAAADAVAAALPILPLFKRAASSIRTSGWTVCSGAAGCRTARAGCSPAGSRASPPWHYPSSPRPQRCSR
nr:M48 family metalloprotease [Lentzea albidocapillata]